MGVCRWTSWGFLGISGWLGENSGLPVLIGKALVVPVVEFVVGRRGITVNRVVRAIAYLKAEVGVCRWTSWGFLGISGWLGEEMRCYPD